MPAVKIIMNHSRPVKNPDSGLVKKILDQPKTSQPKIVFLTGKKFSAHENKSRNILKEWICTSLDGMCNSRKYPYLPHGRDFFQGPPPPPLWKFQLSFIHFFKFFGLAELHPPSPPQEIPIPSVGGVWIFSGTAQ